MNVEDPPWRVSGRRQGDGSYLIWLVAGDISLELDVLEAHKLGSALHAVAGPHLDDDGPEPLGPLPLLDPLPPL